MEDSNGTTPSSNGKDPRTGRFVKGWKGGPGNPMAGKVQTNRLRVLNANKPRDATAIFKKLVELARGGDVKAMQLYFDITGVRIKKVEADVTTHELTPDEARSRVAAFFGTEN